jgi:tRNA nucleotidyltransferase (CCA-adding enzyme)
VYLAALSYILTAEQGEAFINRLNMPSRWAGVVRDTIALRQELPLLGDMSSGQLCSALDRFDPISVEAVALLSDSLWAREALERYLKVLRHIKPSLNGRDIISLGVAQGPMVGEILRKLRAARADGRVATREEEIQAVKNHISHISRDRRLP